jgi:hypothetical protein
VFLIRIRLRDLAYHFDADSDAERDPDLLDVDRDPDKDPGRQMTRTREDTDPGSGYGCGSRCGLVPDAVPVPDADPSQQHCFQSESVRKLDLR